MGFDASFENIRFIGRFLTVRYRGQELALDLDRYLSAVNGKFQWGGQGGFSAARKPTLVNGSELRGDLLYNNQWYQDQIDLSTNIQLRNGELAYVARPSQPPPGRAIPPRAITLRTSRVITPRPITRRPITRRPSTPREITPPPSYNDTSYRTFSSQRIISDASYSSYSKRSSAYLEFSVGNSLTLRGSILHARGRRSGERDRTFDSELDLDPYIGIIDGKLIWGRTGFFSVCKNVRLEVFILHAECQNDSHTIVNSTLDLSRFLQIYNGKLDVKVTEKTGEEMTELFSEARWLKSKVVTELDSAEAVKVFEEKAAFRVAFSALAGTTSRYVQAEMEEFSTSASAAEYIKDAMAHEIKAATITLISNVLSEKVENEFPGKVGEAFKDMVDAALVDISAKFDESVANPIQERIVATCNRYTKEMLGEVRASTIAHFQERAEIMMERHIITASIRRAQTKARILDMIMQGDFV